MKTNYLIGMNLLILAMAGFNYAQEEFTPTPLDSVVEKFLEENRNDWQDMNIPASDGKVLFDIIVERGYTRALEIGTSTGHSAIWIAWALSKTGGTLTTIEIDERHHQKALDNFKEAGVDSLIQARLADAHRLVPQLVGPYDFIFVDADKDWYSQYLRWLYPKLKTGGCFTAHNVLNKNISGISKFLVYLESLKDMKTAIVRSSGSGISVSYKVK